MNFHLLDDGNVQRCEADDCNHSPHFLTGAGARTAYEAPNGLPTFLRITRAGTRHYQFPDGRAMSVEPRKVDEDGKASVAFTIDAPRDELRESLDAFLNSEAAYLPYEELPEEFKPF